MSRDLRIAFMGTPDFAVASLRAIAKAGYNIVAVITAPDKPAGRGKHYAESPVKQTARELGLNILQPVNLKSHDFIEQFKATGVNLAVVVAFRMLPEAVWSMPEYGTFNLHASLLPQYRGAAPINRAIMNGENTTGLTTFFLQHEIDTGDILLSQKVSIGQDETAGQLHDKLMVLGAELVVDTIQMIETGKYETKKQDYSENFDGELKTAPKIFKEHCIIDWSVPGEMIINHIRGLSPIPGAFSYLTNDLKESRMLKIFSAQFNRLKHQSVHGSIETDGKNYFNVFVCDGIIQVNDLQLQGKKRMDIKSFLNGFDISSRWRFCAETA